MSTSVAELEQYFAGLSTQVPQDPPAEISPEQIREHAQGILSENPDTQFVSVQALRRCLSLEHNPQIQQVIDAGAVPGLVKMLQRNDQPKLQYEAAWALTNIASGSSAHARVVIEANALPSFVALLSSPHEPVREQVVWALGNIAGDCSQFRDFVLKSGALQPMLACLTGTARASLVRNVAWTVSNLCRGKPLPPFEAVSPALPYLARLLWSNDVEVLADACWAMSFISDGPNDRIQGIVESGAVPRLVQLMTHEMRPVQIAALRAVGNITTGDDFQTQVAINAGALPALGTFLQHRTSNIRKEACWAISNITAGNAQQIQMVIDAGLIPALLQALQTGDFAVQKEASWAISNATSGGTNEQIAYLVNQGVIQHFSELLGTFGNPDSDQRAVIVVLEGLQHILRSGLAIGNQQGGPNPYAVMLEEAGGMERLEQLQEHPSEEVYQMAVHILQAHFDAEPVAAEGGVAAEEDVAMDEEQ